MHLPIYVRSLENQAFIFAFLLLMPHVGELKRVDSEGGKARSGAKRAFAGLSWKQLIAPQAVIRAKLTP
jgi:hypothetical protein